MNQDADSSVRSKARHPAVKVPIALVLLGQFIEEPEMPSYLALQETKVYRVNILGVVVETRDERNFVIDDGTGRVGVRSFEQLPFKVVVGDLVQLIARPRIYASERYLAPEIVSKTTQSWMRVRKKELETLRLPEATQAINEEVIEEAQEGTPHGKILSFIRSKDQGTGVAMEQVIKETGVKEETLQLLLKEGEVFQVSPGKLKVLE